MNSFQDGPVSPLFTPLTINNGGTLSDLSSHGFSDQMAAAIEHAIHGACVCRGIPFMIDKVVLLQNESTTIDFKPFKTSWLVFLHTSDQRPLDPGESGFYSPMRGKGQLAEHAADYVILYQDGSEARAPIRRRFQLGAYQRRWGENCFEAVAHAKQRPLRASHEQLAQSWGYSQTRVSAADDGPWINWLWAWENPHPDKSITGMRFEPVSGGIVISAISAGDCSARPTRWESRKKALLNLKPDEVFDPELDDMGRLKQIQLDMGQVISATTRLIYPTDSWEGSYNNQRPSASQHQVLVEYTAHPEAHFHLNDGRRFHVSQVGVAGASNPLQLVQPAEQRVTIRVVNRGSNETVPVKLHVHGQWGEYLAPLDRHRIPNPEWFEDYSVDFIHSHYWHQNGEPHFCTYIPGETRIDLPLGPVYIEVSKGFEIRPVRKVVDIKPDTEEIIIEIEKSLAWRERGWVTADTHVHFLSPMTALLEGSAEGVNIINLLVSQWGELMTNVGDFDGRTTWGSKEAGGEGEYLVRVGTENRQHVLGHISLLGYGGSIISPMTTGGPGESALGDPIEVLLTEWARQCKQQGGLVVLPHFPNPRAEHAASIVAGEIDAIEMTSWGDLYSGIDPYSLSDWYRYLNCGYFLPAVGGTDKMAASMAVGTVRTYARIKEGAPFTYQAWMEAVRSRETFVTYGPLLDFSVDGQAMGGRIQMSSNGGRVDVEWRVASVTTPMTRVELVVNGEIRESVAVGAEAGKGQWSFQAARSCWLALLVRGQYPGQEEMIAAHSSPVMIHVQGSAMLPAADAVTILEQIEGALAYLDTVGTRAQTEAYKRMRLELQSAHRKLHNRMHQAGFYHEHTVGEQHEERS